MSSHLSKAGPINLVENISIIVPSKAYEGSNTLLKLTPLKDEYCKLCSVWVLNEQLDCKSIGIK